MSFIKILKSKRLYGIILILLLIRIGLTYFKKAYQIKTVDSIKIEYDADLAETLQDDNGTGCDLPYLDPFYAAMMKHLEKPYPRIRCGTQVWVKCRFSICSLQPVIIETLKDIRCVYQDIIHINDKTYKLSAPITLIGNEEYTLQKSDHVRILCSARKKNSSSIAFWNLKTWVGYGYGLRQLLPRTSLPGRENSPNIVIISVDSLSKNGFIRLLPKSYKFIQEQLNATILNKYNAVGDGTPEAIIPIFAGKRFFELNESRPYFTTQYFDPSSLIFEKLAADGYRTAYFEDSPNTGTFSYRYNGLPYQPTDHYLFSFLHDVSKHQYHLNDLCIGDTPQFKVLLDLTDQFVQIKGKHFIFSFIVGISHDDEKYVPNADEPLVDFLKGLLKRGHQKDTLIIVMGDHGQKFGEARLTHQGMLEERLPFMAIRLPDNLRKRSPEAQLSLKTNADVLTAPHDIYSTLLDVIDLPQFKDKYKVDGASVPRGLSLLKPIPANRSCSEAGITQFWCTCIEWEDVNKTDAMYERAAQAILDHINSMTEFLRFRCEFRTLTSIYWVKKGKNRKNMNRTINEVKYQNEKLYVKLTVGPSVGVYEGLVKYVASTNQYVVDSREVSRTNAYGHEPDCISSKYPHLNNYCYCK